MQRENRAYRGSYRAWRSDLFAAMAAGGANLDRAGWLASTGIVLATESTSYLEGGNEIRTPPGRLLSDSLSQHTDYRHPSLFLS